jgi:glycosyltransferase involved in cell wall biosynthesis
VRDSRPDIVHLHSYCYQLTASILPAIRAAGLPVIQTAHEYKHVCANQHLYNQRTGQICEACRGGRWYAPVLTRCLKGSRAAGAVACVESLLDRALAMRRRHIDRIIAPSHFLRAKLIEFGWPPHRIQRVPNFVFPEDFNPSRPAEPYFLFVGRLVAHKGVRALLRALRRLPEARLLVAGDGPLRAEVERATGELAGRLRWLGFVQEETLRMLLERCLAVVVPSEWYENCPYSILEALAAGRPVVASRIGGIPELVAHGRNGLLFAPGDEDELVERLAFLWQHREEAARMGREGRGLIEARYSPEVHYEAMAPVMRDLT